MPAPVVVEVVGDITGLQGSLAAAGTQLKTFSAGMTAMGTGLTTMLTVPIAGAALASLASANTIQKAYATIRAATGQTGEPLSKLTDQFDHLFGTLPNDAQDIAKVLSMVWDRLHEGGYNVDEITKKILDMSRMTGESADTLANKMTAVIHQWGVSAQDTSGFMDKVWQATEQGRVNVTKFLTDLATYGPTLRAAFEEGGDSATTAAQKTEDALNKVIPMMGEMEKSGIDVTRSIQGMAYGWANVAKLMDAPTKKTQGTVDDLNKSLSAAGITGRTTGDLLMGAFYGIQHGLISDADAAAIFGPRFSANIVQQIKEGKISAEDFNRILKAQSDTLSNAGKDTLTFVQKLEILKHQFELALAPLGFALIDAISSLMPQIQGLIGSIKGLADWFTNLDQGTKNILFELGAFLALIGPGAIIVGTFVGAIGKIASGFSKVISVLPNYTAATKEAQLATTALGTESTAAGTGVTTLGNQVGITGEKTTAMGTSATVAGGEVTGLGAESTVASGEVGVLGGAATTAEAEVTGLGTQAGITGGEVTGLGAESTVASGEVTAVGAASLTSGSNLVTLSTEATAAGGQISYVGTESAYAAAQMDLVGGSASTAGVEMGSLTGAAAGAGGAMTTMAAETDAAATALAGGGMTGITGAAAGAGGALGILETDAVGTAAALGGGAGLAGESGVAALALGEGGGGLAAALGAVGLTVASGGVLLVGLALLAAAFLLVSGNAGKAVTSLNDFITTAGNATTAANKLAEANSSVTKSYPLPTPKTTIDTSTPAGQASQAAQKKEIDDYFNTKMESHPELTGGPMEGLKTLSAEDIKKKQTAYEDIGIFDPNVKTTTGGDMGTTAAQQQLMKEHPEYYSYGGPLYNPVPTKAETDKTNTLMPSGKTPFQELVQDPLGSIWDQLTGKNTQPTGANVTGTGKSGISTQAMAAPAQAIAMPSVQDILNLIHIPTFDWHIPSISDIIGLIHIPNFGWTIPSISDILGIIHIPNFGWTIPSISDILGLVHIPNFGWHIPSISDILGLVHIPNFGWSIPSIGDILGLIHIPNFGWSIPSISDILGLIHIPNFGWSIPSVSDILGKFSIPTFGWNIPSAGEVLSAISSHIPTLQWPAITDTGGVFGAAKAGWSATKSAYEAAKAKGGQILTDAQNALHGIGLAGGGWIPGLAGGASSAFGVTNGPQLRWVGEAGPEMIIPRKYWWAVPDWLFDVLPKLQEGGVSIPASPVGIELLSGVPSSTNTGTKEARTVEYNLYISVDSENIKRDVFEAIRQLEDYHHIMG